jgi:ligand-binding SRPBCC domain-containing protein
MIRLGQSPPETVWFHFALNVEVNPLTRHLIVVVVGNVAEVESSVDVAAAVVVQGSAVQCHQTENCSDFVVVG